MMDLSVDGDASTIDLTALSKDELMDMVSTLQKDLEEAQTSALKAEAELLAERTSNSLLVAEMQGKLAESDNLVTMLRERLAASEDQVTRLQRRLKMAMGSHDQLQVSPQPLSGGSTTSLSASASTFDLAQADSSEEVVLRRPPRLDQIPPDRRVSFYSKPRWTEIVRKNRFLYIKVSEVKDLPKTKVGLSELWESQGVYCVLTMDKSEVARTKKTSSKLNLWNEEFNLDIPANFERLTITVYMKGTVKSIFKDDAIAQMTLKKDLLMKDGLRHEEWHPLYHARRMQDTVYGAIQLGITLTSRKTDSLLTLTVRVLSARHLGAQEDDSSAPCNAYVALHILPDDELATTKQTSIKPDTASPVFHETFTFTLTRQQVADGRLHVSVWHVGAGIGTSPSSSSLLSAPSSLSTPSKSSKSSSSTAEHEFLGQIITPLCEFPIVDISDSDPSSPTVASATDDMLSGHWYPLGGRLVESSSHSLQQTVASKLALIPGSSKILKRASSTVRVDKNELGKLTRQQMSLATLVKMASQASSATAGNGSGGASGSSEHEFVPFKPDEPTDCDQCGGPLVKTFLRCKVCNLTCHDNCRALLHVDCATAGALRVSYKFTEEFLLPYGAYNNLMHLLSENRLAILMVLSSVCEIDRLQEVAKSSLNIFQSQGSAVRFVSQLITEEILLTKDPNTIFRGNSLATKTIDYYMKLIGGDYLASVLRKPIGDIFTEHKNCELDPTKLADMSKKNSVDFAANRRTLINYVRRILDAIFTSLDRCPKPLRDIFAHMQAEVIRKFPDEPLIRYVAVSGFIFLRFFNPAILGPKLFGLRDSQPDATVARTLTLIAKTVMNLANLCEFGQKEPFMIELNPLLEEKKPAMMLFIDALANNRESTLARMKDLEGRIKHELKIFEGVENMSKAQKSANADKKRRSLVRKQLVESQEKIDQLRRELDSLRRIVEQLNNVGADDRVETDYSKKFNFDVDLELARLHHHLVAKRENTMAVLENSALPEYQMAARALAVALDELDEIRERLAAAGGSGGSGGAVNAASAFV